MVDNQKAPYKSIPIKSKVFKNEKIEIRIYNGDEDPTKLNLKRIGVYLYKNDEFIASEWIECGKVVGGVLLNKPDMTNSKKEEMVKNATSKMRGKFKEFEKNTIIKLQEGAIKK